MIQAQVSVELLNKFVVAISTPTVNYNLIALQVLAVPYYVTKASRTQAIPIRKMVIMLPQMQAKVFEEGKNGRRPL